MVSFSPRKEAMFIAGKRLMLSKGYTATTVDEIVAEVGITNREGSVTLLSSSPFKTATP